MKKLNGNKGFTLVEVMIVIVIIAIMAALLVPALSGAVTKAQESSVMQSASRALEAAQVIATEQYARYGYYDTAGTTASDIVLKQEDIEGFLGKKFPSTVTIEAESAQNQTDASGGNISKFKYTDSRYGISVELDATTGELKILNGE